MSFLAPLFLVGVLAVGLPILFHLIRRTVRERQVFSTLMFLVPTPPKVTRQSRLENLLLLLLRCLVIGLLALAFSRPFVQKPVDLDPNQADVKQKVILIDISASMQREDLWAQAVKRAEAQIQKADAGDVLGLYSFDDRLHPVVSLEQSKSLSAGVRKSTLLQSLSTLKPGWGRTQLGKVVVAASESLESGGLGKVFPDAIRSVVVISDFAEGSHLEGLQGHEWAKGLAVILEPVNAGKPTNAGLQLLAERSEDEVPEGVLVRVRVSNSSDAKREQFRLMSGEGFTPVGPMDVYVPPGQNRVVTFTARSNVMSKVVLEGDDASFDNQLSWRPEEVQKTRVLCIGGGLPTDPNQPAYYVQRAFPSSRTRSFEILTRTPADLVSATGFDDISLVICGAVLTPAQAGVVRSMVESGRTLLYALPSAEVGPGLGALLGTGELQVREAPVRNFSLLGQIDFQNPIFAPFADAKFADFTKIHFWKHRVLARETLPTAGVVAASFDDGSPALVDIPLGRGSVVLLTAGWQPTDSQLALSTKFVPLLYSLLERSRPSAARVGCFVVGDPLPLAAPGGASSAEVVVLRPDGSSETVRSATYEGTTIPGVYRVGEAKREFVVNLPPEESRTAPLALDHFEKLGLPIPRELTAEERTSARDQKRLMAAAELENRQKLWRWLIVAGFLFVVGETWLAGRGSRVSSV